MALRQTNAPRWRGCVRWWFAAPLRALRRVRGSPPAFAPALLAPVAEHRSATKAPGGAVLRRAADRRLN